MNTPLVSIIMPAYNATEYIEAMLDCVVGQTYKNIEVILINDGSTDDTLDKIQKYALLDSRIAVLDIPNGGVSHARNLGIEKAKGEKILFLDSDDIVEPYTVEHCINYMVSNHTNAVIFGFSHQVGVKKTKSKSKLDGIYRGEEILNKILPRVIGVSFEDINQWIQYNKAFKTEKESPALWHIMCDAKVIRKNGLHFDESLSVGEDLFFFCTYLLHEQSVGYLNEYLYTYILRDGGANLQNQSNAHKRIENKTKLISARLELDKLAYQLYGVDIHKYWEGTLVLSCIQMGLCMAKNKKGSAKGNYLTYKKFVNTKAIKDACSHFKPAKGLKSIPFRILSIWGGVKIFYIYYSC